MVFSFGRIGRFLTLGSILGSALFAATARTTVPSGSVTLARALAPPKTTNVRTAHEERANEELRPSQ